MAAKLALGNTEKTLGWFARAEARKARIHPEHQDFVSTCKRCIDFRLSLFVAN